MSIERFYNKKPELGTKKRFESPLINVKTFNNWLKSDHLKRFVKSGSVLDLSAGKGGDLMKYKHANITHYYGIDISKDSLSQLLDRYNESYKKSNGRDMRFPVNVFHGDFTKRWKLSNLPQVDFVSCQFAIHYAFGTRQQASNAMHNATQWLAKDGYFVITCPDDKVLRRWILENKKQFKSKLITVTLSDDIDIDEHKDNYGIKYDFYLEDAIDVPEYLVDSNNIIELAEECGMKLIESYNFIDYFDKFYQKSALKNVYKLGRFGGGLSLNDDEILAVKFYKTYVFQKTINGKMIDDDNKQKEVEYVENHTVEDIEYETGKFGAFYNFYHNCNCSNHYGGKDGDDFEFKINFDKVKQTYKHNLIKFLKNRINKKHSNKIENVIKNDTLEDFLKSAKQLLPYVKPAAEEGLERQSYHGGEIIKMIPQRLRDKKNLTIFDLGVNTGEILVWVAKTLNISKGNRYGADISDVRLEILKDEFIYYKNIVGVHKLPYKDGSMDIINLSMVLHHIEDLDILKELWRILSDDGVIIMREHDVPKGQFEEFTGFLDVIHLLYYTFQMTEVPMSQYYSRYWSYEDLKDIMVGYGFKEVEKPSMSNNSMKTYFAVYGKK